jgi:DNA mismatch repair protein MutL
LFVSSSRIDSGATRVQAVIALSYEGGMPIQILEPTVAAQIAAGEVVERPASVVKELIENAIDAGARRIAVEARGGGLRELRIQDDGCGIAADEVEVAFQRHATSKLRSADDLWSLATLGFRGEALPSIASVAQVVCTTRTGHEEVGVELRIAGGEIQSRTAVGAQRGTTFSIRNLFYNVPVRRDFLRSEATEANAIAMIVTQYALAYPEIRFSLLLDGRQALQTSGAGDLRDALVELYGLDVARQLLPVAAVFGEGPAEVQVNGLISPPGITRGSRGYLSIFVNRRAIQPRGQIVFVIEEAYHTLLMKGRHPLAVIDLRVHPAAVDINIHPTKSEVKFRDATRVFGALGRAIRDALIDGAGVHPWETAQPPIEAAQRRFDLRSLGGRFDQEPGDQAIERAGAGPLWGVEHTELLSRSVGDAADQPAPAEGFASTGNILPASKLPPLRIIGQVAGSYVIAEAPEGLYVIDQHAAHERITYERLLAQRGRGPIEAQGLLTPQTVEAPAAAQQILLEHADELREWGFEIEDFGASVRVRAIPATLAPGDLGPALLDVADRLMGRGGATPEDWRERMLTTLACHTAVRAGQTLSFAELRELIIQLGNCAAPRTCPHGRPTMMLLSTQALERQFGRTK